MVPVITQYLFPLPSALMKTMMVPSCKFCLDSLVLIMLFLAPTQLTLVLGVRPNGPMEKSLVSLDRELSISS